MSDIISLVAANKNLLYVDPETDRTYSFNQLFQTSEIINSQEKKLAFLYLDNSIHSIAAFWNFFKSNHAIALLSSSLKPEFKASLESLYRPDFIFDLKRTVSENYASEKFNEGSEIFCSNDRTEKKIAPELKLLLSTSGTTGSPKFVKLSEKNLVNNANAIIDYLPIKTTDVTPLNLPIHYSYGLSVLITNSIAGGKIICETNDLLQKEFWNDFEKYKFTSLAGVPYVYETLNRIGFTKKQAPFLRYMTQAGGKLNEKLVTIFSEFSAKNKSLFYIMYGQTEATARMSFLDPQFLNDKKMSIGKAVKDGRFEIDKDTHELFYYGENVFGGYANTVTDLENFSVEQPLKTGDMADVDGDGFYFVTGRIKRIVKLFGNRINLDEIEKALNEHFTSSSFICTGVDDKMLLVGVTPPMRDSDDGKNISQFLYAQFSIHPSVVKIKLIDKVPLTENQKINYSKFIEQHGT